jgi:hypothetical protein
MSLTQVWLPSELGEHVEAMLEKLPQVPGARYTLDPSGYASEKWGVVAAGMLSMTALALSTYVPSLAGDATHLAWTLRTASLAMVVDPVMAALLPYSFLA